MSNKNMSTHKLSSVSQRINVSLLAPKHHCIATLKTGTPCISCLAVHNDLLYVASLNEINVYDLSNYTQVDRFNDDSTSGFVKSIAFDDMKIFTAHQDCKIRVWLMEPCKKHKLVSTMPTVKDRVLHFMLPKNYVTVRRHKKRLWIEHWDTVSCLVVNHGLLYSVSWDKSLKIWNTKDHKCLESAKAHDDAINTMAVSETGTVYTGSADGCIKVWERADGEKKHNLVAKLEKHKLTVNALALNAEGSVLFSGGCDGSVLVWEKEDEEHHMGFTEALCGHTGPILCLINFLDDIFASGSSDRTVRVWRRGKEHRYCCMSVFEGHEKPVKSLVAVTANAAVNGMVSICSGSLDGEIMIWQISASKIKNKHSDLAHFS